MAKAGTANKADEKPRDRKKGYDSERISVINTGDRVLVVTDGDSLVELEPNGISVLSRAAFERIAPSNFDTRTNESCIRPATEAEINNQTARSKATALRHSDQRIEVSQRSVADEGFVKAVIGNAKSNPSVSMKMVSICSAIVNITETLSRISGDESFSDLRDALLERYQELSKSGGATQ